MDVVSWDGHDINDTTNFVSFLHHQAFGLPRVNAVSAARQGRWPHIAAVERPERVIFLEIIIASARRASGTIATYQTQLQQWFDPEDETPKQLVVEDLGGGTAGGNDRYVYAVCEELQAAPNDENNYTFVATLKVHGDVRWRELTPSTTTDWTITATGQTKVVANNGDDDAYPILGIKPTTGKTGDYAYRRWVPVKWRVNFPFTRYPFDLGNDAFDTAALVTASKMLATGDDLRVFVDGVEVDRWLDGINTTTTKVWVNLDFVTKPTVTATLNTAIAASGGITTIDAASDISMYPNAGILMIDDEAFTYTGKNNTYKRFTGVTRAQRGTSEAAHTVGDYLYWIQHDIWVLYGNAAASAPTVDDTYKPIFNLSTSTNASWDYDDFGYGGLWNSDRAGSWYFIQVTNSAYPYGADHGATTVTEWNEIGIWRGPFTGQYADGRFLIYNPCCITNANFQNGEKNIGVYTGYTWTGRIISSTNGISWTTEYDIADPLSAWEDWSRDEALLPTTSKYVGLELIAISPDDYLECADVTLTLNATYIPTGTVGSEQGNYTLACRITNTTTGEAIDLDMLLALNDILTVDTAAKTVILDADDSNQFQALTLVDSIRKDWLKLVPGNNTLQFDDVGTAAVTITLDWEERFYQ